MKIIKITLPLLLLAAMGCSSPKDVEPVKLKFDESSFSNESISLSLSQLSDAAMIAAKAQSSLAELSNGMASTQMTSKDYNEYVFQKEYIPIGMERLVGDIDWNGNAMLLLNMVADIAGYVVAEPANKPLFVPMVNLNTMLSNKQYNVMDIIRAVEASNKDEIDIVIIEESKIININYLF